jgi:hypothetical protein
MECNVINLRLLIELGIYRVWEMIQIGLVLVSSGYDVRGSISFSRRLNFSCHILSIFEFIKSSISGIC